MALQRVRSNMLANNFVLDDDQGLTVGSGNNIYIDTANNQVGINTNTTTHALTVNGDISATNFFGDGSQLTGLSSTLDEVTTNGATTTNSITVGGLDVNSTGALGLPVGTTGDRPTASDGQIRFNSTTNEFEGYNGTDWGALGGGGAVYSTTAPTTNLAEGDLWFDTGTTGELYVYSGTEWLSVTGSGGTAFYQRSFVGDNSTVAYNVYGATNSIVLVYINGVLVTSPADYSYASGTVTFVIAPALNDEINVLVYGAVSGLTVSSLGLNSTDDLSEGSTNLYYTDARVQNYLDNTATLTETDTLSSVTGRGSTTTSNVSFNGTGNSVQIGDTLRIAQTGSGLRMTNVGAFDNDGSDNFRVYATNTLYLRANGETGAGIVIDDVNQNVTIDNDLIVSGNLTVNGTSTTINSTTLTVDDLNITLASGAADATAANGAGITVDGANATITYDSVNDEWDFNKKINVTGSITSNDRITGDGSEAAPAFRFTTDTDTGIFPPAGGDAIGFSLGGVEMLRLDGGATNAILGSKNSRKLKIQTESTNRINVDTTGDVEFYQNGGSVGFHWDYADGRVGIGSNTPTVALDVNGGGSFRMSGGGLKVLNDGVAGNNANIFFGVANQTDGWTIGQGVTANDGQFRVYDNGAGAAYLTIDGSGNVSVNAGILYLNNALNLNSTATSIPGNGGIARLANGYTYFAGKNNGNGAILSNGDGTATIRALSPGVTAGYIDFETGNGAHVIRIDTNGSFLPQTTDQDLGSLSNPWQNVYTQDMHLSNESRETGNDVDGTKGNWTIQEGAEDLYIINNKTGKRFRFKLEELD